MALRMELTTALILIIVAADHTSAQYSFSLSSDDAPAGVQLAPLPVRPLPAGLSTLVPSQNRPTTPRPRPTAPNRPFTLPVTLGGGGGARPLPTAPKPPPIPLRPSRPIATPRPIPTTTTPPPPPTPTLPAFTRPTPPPPIRPRPRPTTTKPTTKRPTTTRRPTTTPPPTTTTHKPQEIATVGGGQGSGPTDTVFTVFKMSDDGSYLFDYTAPSIGLRQREEGFLKSIGDAKVPVKRGFFAYTSPEGKPVSLSYQADENGFRATGDHLPRALSEV